MRWFDNSTLVAWRGGRLAFPIVLPTAWRIRLFVWGWSLIFFGLRFFIGVVALPFAGFFVRAFHTRRCLNSWLDRWCGRHFPIRRTLRLFRRRFIAGFFTFIARWGWRFLCAFFWRRFGAFL
jgi:hypothetical protein